MVDKNKFIVPILAVLLVLLFSGCTQPQKPVKDLKPEDVVAQFWTDLGKGDYEHAYQLSYHANANLTKEMWLDEHVAKWGENGSYIKIYKFNVISTSPINSSLYEGDFKEALLVNTNATIAYMGQNETGELNIVLVNTTDGWKVYGNY